MESMAMLWTGLDFITWKDWKSFGRLAGWLVGKLASGGKGQEVDAKSVLSRILFLLL